MKQARAPQLENSPCLLELQKNPCSNEDPAQLKINKLELFFKRVFKRIDDIVKQLSSKLKVFLKELMKTNTHNTENQQSQRLVGCKTNKVTTRLRKKWKYKQLISGWERITT